MAAAASLALLTVLFTTLPTTAASQRLAAPFPSTASPSLPHSADGILGPGDQDHRYPGFYVGLGTGAAVGIYALVRCSGRYDCAVRPIPFALLTTIVFSITGALVGGAIPK